MSVRTRAWCEAQGKDAVVFICTSRLVHGTGTERTGLYEHEVTGRYTVDGRTYVVACRITGNEAEGYDLFLPDDGNDKAWVLVPANPTCPSDYGDEGKYTRMCRAIEKARIMLA